MSDKFIFRIIIAAVATLMIAFAAVAGMSYLGPKNPAPTGDAKLAALTNGQAVTQVDPIVRSTQVNNAAVDQTPAPLPVVSQPVAGVVDISDLRGLARTVSLKQAAGSGDINKAAWQQALPKAQQLLGGACDCEQRNWLIHFVETANFAVSGDPQFAESAKFLATMPKNDDEATTHKISE